ncbi:MAG: TetR/AcrR family transcriptional regulator [Alphaproteobacteria bacterium]|nr:TetR/AcrR family transcriptional regulator [Alphaproteobacteria bacterium]
MNEPDAKAQRIAANHDFKRKAILGAARTIVQRSGPQALTMRAVAAEAGYAPGAVYFYYQGKDEIAAALVAEELATLARRLKDADAPLTHASAAHRIATLAEETFKSITAESHLLDLAAEMFDGGHVPPEAERLLNGKLISALTALGAPANALTEADADSRRLTLCLAAMVLGAAVLQRSGRLDMLGVDAQDVLRFGVDRLAADAA